MIDERRGGHAFQLALSDAIGNAVGELDRGALLYRGLDLGPAVARAIYVALSNDAALYEAHANRSLASVRVAGGLEAAVARRMLGLAPVVVPSRLARVRNTLAGERALRRIRPAARGPALAATGGVWFLLDHPKFAPLVAPVARALGQDRPQILEIGALAAESPTHTPSLRQSGAALRALPSVVEQADRMLGALARRRPDRVVVVEGNSPFDAVASAAAHALGVPVTCVQNGWSPIVHAGFRRMPYDVMCVWGDGFAEQLRPYNTGLRFAVTGNPALSEKVDGGRLAAIVDGRPAAAFFMQTLSPYIGVAQHAAFVRLAVSVAEAHPDAAVLVREHPAHPLRESVAWPRNVIQAPATEFVLREVILAARVVASIYSTSLLESAALGRPPVILNQTSLPRYQPDLEALGAGVELRDAHAAAATIGELLTDSGAVERFRAGMDLVRARYFAGLPRNAAGRVAAAVSASAPA